MTDLAPEVFRQRLLIEGRFGGEMTEARLRSYLLGLAAHLGLRTYGEPVIHAPAAGTGRAENAGFDAFVPLIDSGIAAYVWSGPRFFSVVLFTVFLGTFWPTVIEVATGTRISVGPPYYNMMLAPVALIVAAALAAATAQVHVNVQFALAAAGRLAHPHPGRGSLRPAALRRHGAPPAPRAGGAAVCPGGCAAAAGV